MSRILVGDVLDKLSELPDESVQCVVTSPPYWGLRDYGVDGQLGLEPTLDAYVEKMTSVFRDVRRVLRADGTLWLNLGDSYAAKPVGSFNGGGFTDRSAQTGGRDLSGVETSGQADKLVGSGLKPKDLCGVPWRIAFALQADGWYLRSDIIWSKPSPMPESVRDRPTKAHEYIFLLSKSGRYYWDAGAIASPAVTAGKRGGFCMANGGDGYQASAMNRKPSGNQLPENNAKYVRPETTNARTVWTIPTQPFPEAHFATFPEALAEKCIRAGSKWGDTVFDPFLGSGTTAVVAKRLGREWRGIELNPEYAAMAERRIARVVGAQMELIA